MLRFSESDPDFVVDPARVEQLGRAIADSDYETKVVGLIERSYQRDVGVDPQARTTYASAAATLREGDHYISVMIEQALASEARAASTSRSGLLARSGLFVLLVLPGGFAILLAIGLVATAVAEGVSSESVGGLVGSVLVGGMGYYLIHLWRRERNARRLQMPSQEPEAHDCEVSWRHVVLIATTVAGTFLFLSALARYLGHAPTKDERGFFAWLIALGLAGVYALVRIVFGERAVTRLIDLVLWPFIGGRK
jgi:hypothetical protein